MSSTIQAKERNTGQHSTLTTLRNEGIVPSVVYGYKTEATSITVNERDLVTTLRDTGRNGVLQLLLNDQKLNVVLNDYQADALKGTILHADFLEVNLTEELEVDVQINLIGESNGEKEGGTVQQPNWELTIKVKPSDIPEAFDVDVSNLAIGDTLTVADIREASKFEILNDDDYGLVTISAPRTAAELEALDDATESASVEPEVIGEKDE